MLPQDLAKHNSVIMVSVIVSTYNRPNMLVQALRSILDQTCKNVEIIVVNDGGVDVEDTITRLNHKNSITYIRHSRNRGSAATRNTGIKVARGKYIAYLDDDDVFYPDHLETLVNFLESSDYEVAYTDAYRAIQEKKDGEFQVTSRDVPYSVDFDYDLILVENFVPLLCFMHEKACLDEVGLFNEDFMTFEDWDLWIRMSRKFKFAHIKKVTCEFAWRQDGTTKSSKKRIKLLREKVSGIIYDRYTEYKKNRPEVVETHNTVGVLYFKQGQKKKALNHFQEAVRLDPDNLTARKNLADTYLEFARGDEAIRIYQEILAKNPNDVEALLATGNLCLLSGRFEEASSYYSKILQVEPENILANQGLEALQKSQPTT